ncbi:hypothetical protein Lal_00020533 [Lupinus albus]|nr:hypothetical protein Lal_00020533 [Lupinus albus]
MAKEQFSLTRPWIHDTVPLLLVILIALHVLAMVYWIYKLATQKQPQQRRKHQMQLYGRELSFNFLQSKLSRDTLSQLVKCRWGVEYIVHKEEAKRDLTHLACNVRQSCVEPH